MSFFGLGSSSASDDESISSVSSLPLGGGRGSGKSSARGQKYQPRTKGANKPTSSPFGETFDHVSSHSSGDPFEINEYGGALVDEDGNDPFAFTVSDGDMGKITGEHSTSIGRGGRGEGSRNDLNSHRSDFEDPDADATGDTAHTGTVGTGNPLLMPRNTSNTSLTKGGGGSQTNMVPSAPYPGSMATQGSPSRPRNLPKSNSQVSVGLPPVVGASPQRTNTKGSRRSSTSRGKSAGGVSFAEEPSIDKGSRPGSTLARQQTPPSRGFFGGMGHFGRREPELDASSSSSLSSIKDFDGDSDIDSDSSHRRQQQRQGGHSRQGSSDMPRSPKSTARSALASSRTTGSRHSTPKRASFADDATIDGADEPRETLSRHSSAARRRGTPPSSHSSPQHRRAGALPAVGSAGSAGRKQLFPVQQQQQQQEQEQEQDMTEDSDFFQDSQTIRNTLVNSRSTEQLAVQAPDRTAPSPSTSNNKGAEPKALFAVNKASTYTKSKSPSSNPSTATSTTTTAPASTLPSIGDGNNTSTPGSAPRARAIVGTSTPTTQEDKKTRARSAAAISQQQRQGSKTQPVKKSTPGAQGQGKKGASSEPRALRAGNGRTRAAAGEGSGEGQPRKRLAFQEEHSSGQASQAASPATTVSSGGGRRKKQSPATTGSGVNAVRARSAHAGVMGRDRLSVKGADSGVKGRTGKTRPKTTTTGEGKKSPYSWQDGSSPVERHRTPEETRRARTAEASAISPSVPPGVHLVPITNEDDEATLEYYTELAMHRELKEKAAALKVQSSHAGEIGALMRRLRQLEGDYREVWATNQGIKRINKGQELDIIAKRARREAYVFPVREEAREMKEVFEELKTDCLAQTDELHQQKRKLLIMEKRERRLRKLVHHIPQILEFRDNEEAFWEDHDDLEYEISQLEEERKEQHHDYMKQYKELTTSIQNSRSIIAAIKKSDLEKDRQRRSQEYLEKTKAMYADMNPRALAIMKKLGPSETGLPDDNDIERRLEEQKARLILKKKAHENDPPPHEPTMHELRAAARARAAIPAPITDLPKKPWQLEKPKPQLPRRKKKTVPSRTSGIDTGAGPRSVTQVPKPKIPASKRTPAPTFTTQPAAQGSKHTPAPAPAPVPASPPQRGGIVIATNDVIYNAKGDQGAPGHTGVAGQDEVESKPAIHAAVPIMKLDVSGLAPGPEDGNPASQQTHQAQQAQQAQQTRQAQQTQQTHAGLGAQVNTGQPVTLLSSERSDMTMSVMTESSGMMSSRSPRSADFSDNPMAFEPTGRAFRRGLDDSPPPAHTTDTTPGAAADPVRTGPPTEINGEPILTGPVDPRVYGRDAAEAHNRKYAEQQRLLAEQQQRPAGVEVGNTAAGDTDADGDRSRHDSMTFSVSPREGGERDPDGGIVFDDASWATHSELSASALSEQPFADDHTPSYSYSYSYSYSEPQDGEQAGGARRHRGLSHSGSSYSESGDWGTAPIPIVPPSADGFVDDDYIPAPSAPRGGDAGAVDVTGDVGQAHPRAARQETHAIPQPRRLSSEGSGLSRRSKRSRVRSGDSYTPYSYTRSYSYSGSMPSAPGQAGADPGADPGAAGAAGGEPVYNYQPRAIPYSREGSRSPHTITPNSSIESIQSMASFSSAPERQVPPDAPDHSEAVAQLLVRNEGGGHGFDDYSGESIDEMSFSRSYSYTRSYSQ
eukprot:TRINITY_DN528_c0_g1_i5.p1 TRINITY_DN528_c0_g1~~TRINITY_DN528_c0_g1_i5.p1  ORF type:complete len:1682 (+),score=290.02 TRINITY_DN528_c0_g1_i5:287-5332(+)